MVRSDQQRVRSLLAEAITILCKNCLAYKSEFCVEGLLGITLDNEEVFLVNIKENVSGGATGGGPQMPMQPELQMMEQVSARMARPMPIKSPFIPSRGPFGQRTRGRGRGAFRMNPTARKHTYKLPGRQGRGGRRSSIEPPSKRMSLEGNVVHIHTNETPSTDTNGEKDTEYIVLKEEPSQEGSDTEKDISQQDNAEESSVSDQKTAASANPGDPLYQSLDFGDMLRQYEEPPSGDHVQHHHQAAASSDTSQDADKSEKQDIVVIKPEKEDSTSCAEESPVAMPPFTQPSMLTPGVPSQDSMMFGSPMDQSGGMYVGQSHSGPVFPGGPLPMPGQFMDPTSTMPGCSSWDQVPQVSLPSRLPGSSPGSASKRSSGGGRASAAAGSPSQRSSQGSSSQAGGMKRFECGICCQIFFDSSTLRRHVNSIHTRNKMYTCLFCLRVFSRRDNLKTHMINRHSHTPDTAKLFLTSSKKFDIH